jgi:hypothetical protein
MSNHYHLVVKLNPYEPNSWSDDDVLNRWTSLYRGPLLVQRYCAGEELSAVELDTVRSMAAVYRSRLGNLSWFMKCLNEPIARKANAEDHCTGHFWEARFYSQPLCSERALVTAMAYVDLNPIRAGIAATPEQSEYTSIRARLKGDYEQDTLDGAVARVLAGGEILRFASPVRSLMPFADEVDAERSASSTLPIYQKEYFKLVDSTGLMIAPGKRGRIDPELAPVLVRLGLSESQWGQACSAFRQHYRNGDLRIKQAA